RPPSARAVRWPAAARRDRTLADERSAVPARRRGDGQPRQQDRARDPRAPRRAAHGGRDHRHGHPQRERRRALRAHRLAQGRRRRAGGPQSEPRAAGRCLPTMIQGFVRTTRLGVKSLMLHKLRSSLTMLGLLFGVAAVIGMLSIGEGASRAALERIKALGSTNIILRSKKPPQTEQSSSGNVWDAQFYGLTYRDARRIAETLPEARRIVQVRETPCELRVGARWE